MKMSVNQPLTLDHNSTCAPPPSYTAAQQSQDGARKLLHNVQFLKKLNLKKLNFLITKAAIYHQQPQQPQNMLIQPLANQVVILDLCPACQVSYTPFWWY